MPKSLWKLCNAYLPVVLWASLIYFFSAQSSLPGFDVSYDYFFKKLSHMFVYGVFYFLLHRGVNLDTPMQQQSRLRSWLVPFILVLIYATTDELHQVFTTNRHPSPIDVGFDMIGASVAFLRMYKYI